MTRTRRQIRSEDGSVYLLAILVLLVLTIVGLALAITTQSEMQIGANEESSRRTFYSANAGISISTAKALVVPDLRSMEIDLVVPAGDEIPDLQIRNRLQMSPFTPIQDGPCNLCQVNQDSPFFKINHAVAATSTRIGWQGDPDDPPDQPVPLAQERLSVMVAFQPWRMETLTAVNALTDDNTGGVQEVGY